MFQSFQTPVYAGFWLRFAAYLIDSIILGLVFVPVGFALGIILAATGSATNDADPLMVGVNGLINVGSILAGWLYSSLLESSSWQGTVGKKLIGLRVTDLNGNRISFGKATGRYFGKILSGMICMVGFFMAAFTEKAQALHDQLAGTLVLSGPATITQYEPPPPPDFGYSGR
ncbi:MAG TPA: RDD family protein [Pyrinomonadaceae bacterium]|nr:RDD family protein [Pyrinomonadaceae bacterium]